MVDRDYFDHLPPFEDDGKTELTRRDFLAGSSIAITCLAASGAALTPLLDAKEVPSKETLLQEHYKRLTEDDKKEIFARLEAEIKRDYKVDANIIQVAVTHDSAAVIWNGTVAPFIVSDS